MHHFKSQSRGMTLLELMVVVAVVGILASLAIPSYKDAMLKGRRAEGRTALLELMQAQERYATQTNCYLGFTNSPSGVPMVTSPGGACGGISPSSVPFKNFSGDNPDKGVYWLSASACDGLSIQICVKVLATPKLDDPQVGTLSLTSTGSKTCTGTEPNKCWR
jgi:type IV pilus assembly protein PilE